MMQLPAAVPVEGPADQLAVPKEVKAGLTEDEGISKDVPEELVEEPDLITTGNGVIAANGLLLYSSYLPLNVL